MATKSKAKAGDEAGSQVTIPPLQIEEFSVTIVGDAELVCHKWSEKAIKMMEDKHARKPKADYRPVRKPRQEFLDSLYPHPDGGWGFPAIAFKKAAVRAAKGTELAMVDARVCFHVMGDLIKIKGKPIMREDMVRVGRGSADIRYRGTFKEWSCKLRIRYDASLISASQLINLINKAGFGVGVGEYRPEKDGSWGLYHVKVQAA